MGKRILEQLLADNPDFHKSPDGITFSNWSVTPDALRFLFSLLRPDMRTIETGAGQSTIVFMIAGTNHTSITPLMEEAKRIFDYSTTRLGVDRNVRFIHEYSDKVLPMEGVVSGALDLVFIDGAHRFPIPTIDWYYTKQHLKVGGVVGIDDYKIPAVKVLFDFLCEADEWVLMDIVDRTAFFKRIRKTHVRYY
jgi:predicted O-methyltransferase YrrM